MKNYKNILNKALLISLISILISSCQIGRFVIYNFADINDHKKFKSRPLKNDSLKFTFKSTQNPFFPANIKYKNGGSIAIDSFLAKNNSVAFLIIKNDTIQYEKYFRGYDETRIVPSFSMAKSVTSILIGCAIDDKLIQSVNEPVTNYLPELQKNGFEKVTIKHLLQMTSGLDFKESYINPFGHAASFYYGRSLRNKIQKLKLKAEPGSKFEYVSGNPQLLGLILERALKNKTITQYLQEKLWKPLGMEYEASWSIDKEKNGLEKTFCCINARARDFAKIGRLYLNNGNWNGKQIVSANWVQESTKNDTTEGSVQYYQYQWWKPTTTGDFMAEGILGQFVYVNPAKNLIIVRLGKNEGKTGWWNVFTQIASKY
jgi:CubicO group peptidase (beta-lactamase class C family)